MPAGAASSFKKLVADNKAKLPWGHRIPSENPNDKSSDAEINMKAFINLTALAWTNPSHCLAVADYFSDRVKKQQSEAAMSDADVYFQNDPEKVRDLDIEWCIAVILAADIGWTAEMLASARAFAEEQIYEIFSNLHNVGLHMKLGKHANNKLIMRYAFSRARASAGIRQAALRDPRLQSRVLVDNGKIDWGVLGSYEPVPTGGAGHNRNLVVEIRYRPNDTRAPCTSSGVYLGKWWTDNNWSDTRGEIAKSKTDRHKFIDYFTDNRQGPHLMATLVGTSKTWLRYVEQAKADLETKQAAVREGVLSSPAAVQDEFNKKRMEQKALANELVAKRAAERAVKRRCLTKTLSDPKPPASSGG